MSHLVIINRSFGGFHVPEAVQTKLGYDRYPRDEWEARTNKKFIDWVLANKSETALRVAEIPAEATDFELLEYDGMESIIMSVGGRLVYAETL